MQSLKKKGTLGAPTPLAAEFLLGLIDEQLLSISKYNSSHDAAISLVGEEAAVLRATRSRIEQEILTKDTSKTSKNDEF